MVLPPTDMKDSFVVTCVGDYVIAAAFHECALLVRCGSLIESLLQIVCRLSVGGQRLGSVEPRTQHLLHWLVRFLAASVSQLVHCCCVDWPSFYRFMHQKAARRAASSSAAALETKQPNGDALPAATAATSSNGIAPNGRHVRVPYLGGTTIQAAVTGALLSLLEAVPSVVTCCAELEKVCQTKSIRQKLKGFVKCRSIITAGDVSVNRFSSTVCACQC